MAGNPSLKFNNLNQGYSMSAHKISFSQKITPFLWFDHNAEAAVKFYTSVFKQSKILGLARYTQDSHRKPGSVMTVAFRILGQEFTALNGGPHFRFSSATSFVIHCKTQAEVDYYWKNCWLVVRPSNVAG
jgi:predicted 3-demethylubiquinone-9 3-methyltransferase (glyoxalase superfamily)